MDTSAIDAARQAATNNEMVYGQPRLVYGRAAIIASHKLNKNVSEFDVATIQISYVESLLSATKADPKLYAEMIRLLMVACEFSTDNTDNFSPMNLRNVEAAIDEGTQKIAKMFAPMPKVEKVEKSDDSPS